MSVKKKPKEESVEFKFIPIDRDKVFPCRICRKRVSCFIRPRDGKCTSLEEGIPWSMPSNPMYDDDEIDID